MIRRRTWLAATAASLLPVPALAAPPTVRLGVLQFGSVQWVADVIRRHGLDASHGFTLAAATVANNDASRVALMAGAADIVVSDWFFAASQRAAGTRLSFVPFSSASGAIMVPDGSPIRALPDLVNRRLGVAGGPLDKSWLIVQAAAQATNGIDLAAATKLTYGAPPLLNAMVQHNDVDAVLTFWNFAAKLDAAGFRQTVSVADCARTLGLSDHLSLVGYTFHEDWAKQNPDAINGFLAASAAAQAIMARDDAEWDQIRPLMSAPDDDLFHSLRRRFVDGMQQTPPATQATDAAKLFEIVRRSSGTRGTGGLDTLPDGLFWEPPHG